MKKLWSLFILSFVLTLSMFAQDFTVSMDRESSTKSQNINPALQEVVKVCYNFTAKADVEISGLKFKMLGTSGAIKELRLRHIGSAIGSVAEVINDTAYVFNVNTKIAKGTIFSLDVFLNYFDFGSGIQHGSTAQICLTSVKYSSNETATEIKVTTEPSPLMTLVALTATTDLASNINATRATINGFVTGYAKGTVFAWFEWGQDPNNLINQTDQQIFEFTIHAPVNSYLNNLSSNTTYYYRMVARDEGGLAYGSILSFTTATSWITIPRRVVGAGTNTDIPFFASNANSFKGFEFTVRCSDPLLIINHYSLGQMLNNISWASYGNQIYSPQTGIPQYKIVALGDEVDYVNNLEIIRINYKIGQNTSGTTFLKDVSLYDGKNYWNTSYGELVILDLPRDSYCEFNNDGKRDISDVIEMKDLLGKSLNDTLAVKSDLDGDGILTSADLYYALRGLVHGPGVWPIFYDYTGPVYGKVSTPVTATWQKLASGKWGLFSKDTITNGDLVTKNAVGLSAGSGLMLQKVGEKIYFAGDNGIVNKPILELNYPAELTGTVNEGRRLIVTPLSVTAVEEKKIVPKEFNLAQNYPNPFNPSTTIAYNIPKSEHVTLKVYDINGKEVMTLVNEEKPAGSYSVKFDASGLSSGTYIYRVSAGKFIETRKMVLMK